LYIIYIYYIYTPHTRSICTGPSMAVYAFIIYQVRLYSIRLCYSLYIRHVYIIYAFSTPDIYLVRHHYIRLLFLLYIFIRCMPSLYTSFVFIIFFIRCMPSLCISCVFIIHAFIIHYTSGTSSLYAALQVAELYCCFTAALLLLYCCFTAALLLLYCCFTTPNDMSTLTFSSFTALNRASSPVCKRFSACFTAALLLLYCCFTTRFSAVLSFSLPLHTFVFENKMCSYS
jgi:hypothetical protein